MVYFTASFGGMDNIFKVSLQGGAVEELNTQWELGNYQVNVSENKITWTALTAEGYQLQQIDVSQAQWKPVEDILTKRLAISYPVAQANSVSELLNNHLPARNFESKPYSKSTGLLNFHSWRPYYEDPEFTFSIYGQNILNTLETQLYYAYNENERTSSAGVSAVYGKWFTQLNIGSAYTFGRQQQIGQRIR